MTQIGNERLIHSTYLRGLNWSQRGAPELSVDISTTEVINHNNIMSSITQVKGSRPSTESICSKNNDLFLHKVSIALGSFQYKRVESLCLPEQAIGCNSVGSCNLIASESSRGSERSC